MYLLAGMVSESARKVSAQRKDVNVSALCHQVKLLSFVVARGCSVAATAAAASHWSPSFSHQPISSDSFTLQLFPVCCSFAVQWAYRLQMRCFVIIHDVIVKLRQLQYWRRALLLTVSHLLWLPLRSSVEAQLQSRFCFFLLNGDIKLLKLIFVIYL